MYQKGCRCADERVHPCRTEYDFSRARLGASHQKCCRQFKIFLLGCMFTAVIVMMVSCALK